MALSPSASQLNATPHRRMCATLVGLAVCVGSLHAGAGLASAHGDREYAGDGRFPGEPDVVRDGQEVRRFDPESKSYLVRRRPDEPAMQTHVDPIEGGVANGGHMWLPPHEDAPLCTSSGHRLKIVYTHVSGGSVSSAPGNIRTILGRMNWKLMRQAEASSANARTAQLKVQCDSGGQIQVHDVTVPSSDYNQIRQTVEWTLGAPTGADAVKYLIFHEGVNNSVAGVGWGYIGDCCGTQAAVKNWSDNTSSGNFNRIYTTSAITFHSDPSWNAPDYWWTHVTLHELFHSVGGTQAQGGGATAPWATPGAHCLDGSDTLCYDDGSLAGYSDDRCPDNGTYDTPVGMPIDCGFDTYFDTSTEGGEWLTQYWNLGGSENAFFAYTNPALDTYVAAACGGSAGNPTTVGVFRWSTAQWLLRTTNSAGSPNLSYAYGSPGEPNRDVAVACDWDGNGTSTPGVFRRATGQWLLRNSHGSGNPDVTFSYGSTFASDGDMPVVGDWDGNGSETIGVYRSGTGQWLLRNSNSAGSANIVATFGSLDPQLGDIPVVGDWDGNGTTTIGIYRRSTGEWFLRNANSTGGAHLIFPFGTPADPKRDMPVVGDWDGNGTTTVGVYRRATAEWLLRNSNSAGEPQLSFAYGSTDDIPVVGRW
jgi:hypothetical protein